MLGTEKAGQANERPALKKMSPRNQQKARSLGLTSATGLVIGSIIGGCRTPGRRHHSHDVSTPC